MLIDTHCHLDSSMDLERIVKEAKENNVKYLILGGTSLKDNAENICLTKKFSNVFTAVGYHPDSASSFVFDDINILEKQINNNDKVIAIGEIGLDYHYGKENKEKQILLFEEQLKLAEKLHKPVVIHSRCYFRYN